MDVSEFRTLLDFGMVVLLWLVQRVIYPSFLTCAPAKLVDWHKTYTKRAAWIIVPMMICQLPLAAWFAYQNSTFSNVASLCCLLGCWALTFCVSVPLHNKIAGGDVSHETLQLLIRTNWPRTILWTLAFVLHLL